MKRQLLEKEGEEGRTSAMRKRGEKEEEVVDLALLRNVVRLGDAFSWAR